MNTLYIVRGLPGSGKSTLASELAPGQVFEADQFRFNDQGQYVFDPAQTAEVHRRCQEAVRNALAQGHPKVAVANTFVKRWEFEYYLSLAEEYGYQAKVIVCRGEWQNIHGVDSATIARMRANWQD